MGLTVGVTAGKTRASLRKRLERSRSVIGRLGRAKKQATLKRVVHQIKLLCLSKVSQKVASVAIGLHYQQLSIKKLCNISPQSFSDLGCGAELKMPNNWGKQFHSGEGKSSLAVSWKYRNHKEQQFQPTSADN